MGEARAGARVRIELVRYHQMRDLSQAPDLQRVGRRVPDSPAQRDSPFHLRCVLLVLVEHVMGKAGHALRKHRICVQRLAIDEEDAMRVPLASGRGFDFPIRDGRAVIVKVMKPGGEVDSVHESREIVDRDVMTAEIVRRMRRFHADPVLSKPRRLHEEAADVRIAQPCRQNGGFVRLDILQIVGQRGDASWQDKGACPLERVTLAVRSVSAKMGNRVHVERPVEELLGIHAFQERLEDASCGGASFVFGHARSFMIRFRLSSSGSLVIMS